MLAKTFSAAILGVDAFSVEVEINATGVGEQTTVAVVGLPDAAVRESRERVRSALTSSGFLHPFGYTTISLAPADVRKEGAAFDLPIALGMMAAIGQLEREPLVATMIIGELALDGGVPPTHGALPIALHAAATGMRRLILPAANAAEAGLVRDLEVIGVANLADAVTYLKGDLFITPTVTDIASLYEVGPAHALDFAEIKGQAFVKRAMEVAAAGGHNILLIGPPGTGKTMVAQRLPSILPLMTLDEALETTKIHSIAGVLDKRQPLVVERPFRSPHHTTSDAGLLGGQSNPTPGEISLAHHGILFLDEFTEFRRSTLEVMRQPLESGDVTISRALGTFVFPARFQLVAAMNPCPCGYYGSRSRTCRCTPPQIQKYRARISGPLLDRIDLHVEVAPIADKDMLGAPTGEPSAAVRTRVMAARDRQTTRLAGTKLNCNARLTPKLIHQHCALDDTCKQLMQLAITDLQLSSRAYDRILRVARTIADLEGKDHIESQHLSEAVQYRSLDRKLW